MNDVQGLILVIAQEAEQRGNLQAILNAHACIARAATGPREISSLLRYCRFDLILADFNFDQHLTGPIADDVLAAAQHTPVILSTASRRDHPQKSTRVANIRYLSSPINKAKLLALVDEILAYAREERRLLLGRSPQMQRILKMIPKVASTGSAVLIGGEAGTGREMIARMIHRESPRRNEPFFTLNCAGMPDDVLESTLFGVERGANSQFQNGQIGVFEAAVKSTVFLKEVGGLSPTTQAKLLRAIQEQEIFRVGGHQPLRVSIRVIMSCDRSWRSSAEEHRIRENFLHRLNALVITLPPIRERVEDIEPLIKHLLEKHATAAGRPEIQLSPQALDLLIAYSWPGNIRQLDSAIEQAVLMSEGDHIEHVDLPVEIRRGPTAEMTSRHLIPEGGMSLPEHEKQLLAEALMRAEGSITRAAQLLGISFRTMQYRLEKFGIVRNPAPSK